MKIKRLHRGCGGIIKNNVCTHCGHKFGKIERITGFGIQEKEERFSERDYRQRIRNGDDLIKK